MSVLSSSLKNIGKLSLVIVFKVIAGVRWLFAKLPVPSWIAATGGTFFAIGSSLGGVTGVVALGGGVNGAIVFGPIGLVIGALIGLLIGLFVVSKRKRKGDTA